MVAGGTLCIAFIMTIINTKFICDVDVQTILHPICYTVRFQLLLFELLYQPGGWSIFKTCFYMSIVGTICSDFPAARERRMHVLQSEDQDVFFVVNVQSKDAGWCSAFKLMVWR